MSQFGRWIGVDLDGTLARHEPDWHDWSVIGDPIPAMVERVKRWIAEGIEVRILTARVARVCPDRGLCYNAITEWCREYIGQALIVTSEKDPGMIELWDDRAVSVEVNTGNFTRFVGGDIRVAWRTE